mmetsp:Transcript_127265/g.407314  ORF Transcript_127265/g.407314 Transcript_127265/m.407314 type:complete len:208 (+) Transcript_127265:673-1296(+)
MPPPSGSTHPAAEVLGWAVVYQASPNPPWCSWQQLLYQNPGLLQTTRRQHRAHPPPHHCPPRPPVNSQCSHELHHSRTSGQTPRRRHSMQTPHPSQKEQHWHSTRRSRDPAIPPLRHLFAALCLFLSTQRRVEQAAPAGLGEAPASHVQKCRCLLCDTTHGPRSGCTNGGERSGRESASAHEPPSRFWAVAARYRCQTSRVAHAALR